jgi:hypothetical protein
VQANRVLEEADDVRRNGEAQFDNLDVLSKGKAIMGMSFNMKMVSKMPGLMQEALEDFKTDLEEIKEATTELKANMPKVKTDGQACNAKNVKDPVGCYK